MSIQVKAIYENGIFRPLQTVQLAENQEVTVTIEGNGAGALPGGDQVLFVLSPDRWQSFCDALDAPPREIPAVRELLTKASLFDGYASAARKSDPA